MGGCVSTDEAKSMKYKKNMHIDKQFIDISQTKTDFEFLHCPFQKNSSFNQSMKKKQNTAHQEKKLQLKNQGLVDSNIKEETPIHSLSQLFDNTQKDQDEIDFMKACNTKSKIIKLSKKAASGRGTSVINVAVNNEECIEHMEKCDIFEGLLTDQLLNSTLSIKNKDINMEFTLPRCRAGPLVVPYISYDIYEVM